MEPTLVYDDDCGFCTRAAAFVARHGTVELVGFAELSPSLRERLRGTAHPDGSRGDPT